MKESILIVEDETRLAALLADYLAAAGYATRQIAEGPPVVDSVRAHPPALILLDLMLPGRDGLAICRDIRAFSQVPIIMTTARVEEIDRLLGLELGADDYVCKPYSPRELGTGCASVRAGAASSSRRWSSPSSTPSIPHPAASSPATSSWSASTATTVSSPTAPSTATSKSSGASSRAWPPRRISSIRSTGSATATKNRKAKPGQR